MKINQLIVGRRYYFANSPKQFIEVLYRNDTQNIILYEQFSLSLADEKNNVVRAFTAVIPTNGTIHTQEFNLVVPKVSRVVCHFFSEETGFFIAPFKTDEVADQWIAEHPEKYTLLKRETVQYDDPTYVEPKAEDEDEVNEV